MVRLAGAMLIPALVCVAQISPQKAALLRGVLVERAQSDGGELSVRAADDEVVRYRFDARTYVEREQRLIDVGRLRPGERVEVLSDLLSGSPVRYARTIHVIDPAPPRRPANRTRPTISADREPVFPRGDLTLSGVVSRLSDGRLVLRTRESGDETILLRTDTRFVADGQIAAAADLKPNMRVFVRAGKDVYGHVEAYQVAWGEILLPHDN